MQLRKLTGSIETHGIDFIPLAERTSTPANIFWILIGSNLTFGLIVLGWLPISFGLGWWPSFWSIIIGDAIGALILAPSALLGPRTGTNGPVSSGAYFGVVGRIIGSGIAIFISIGFYALAVWTGGQAAVFGAQKLLHIPASHWMLGASYAIIAIISSVVAIYGHASMLAVERLMVPVAGILLLVGVVVYAPHFSFHYEGGKYLLGSFWPTWILAVTIAAVAVYGYVLYVSDWTRYISPERHSDISLMLMTWFGGFLGLSIPLLFGAYTGVAILGTKLDYIPGLVALSPLSYLVPLIILGIVGSLGQSTLVLYGSGLDFSSIFPALRRTSATIILSIIAVILVFLGTMVWNAEESVTAFIQLFGVTTASWLAVVVLGHFRRGGVYDVDALQVFNRREQGGAYWYMAGWNARALIAWLCGSVVGLLFLDCSLFVGPWSGLAGGIDLSWISALLVTSLLYLVLCAVFPERSSQSIEHAAGIREPS